MMEGSYAALSESITGWFLSAYSLILRTNRLTWSSIRASQLFFSAPTDHFVPGSYQIYSVICACD